MDASQVVLVHDWLTGMRGGEKVLESLCRRWPNAPLYTLIHQRGSCSLFQSHPSTLPQPDCLSLVRRRSRNG